VLNESFLGQWEITNNTRDGVPEIVVKEFLGHVQIFMTKFENKERKEKISYNARLRTSGFRSKETSRIKWGSEPISIAAIWAFGLLWQAEPKELR
jgi:hypothetical protein